MPTINPSFVPTISPGNLFTRYTTDTTLNIRWLTAEDPAQYEILNRPLADVTIRTLITAKAIDNINLSLGAQALFPFIINPQVTDGTAAVDVPVRTFWDMHASVSQKWANIRLARIDRLDGDNGSDYTGTLRFIFTANTKTGGVVGSSETAIFYADYTIDSDLTYQRATIEPTTTGTVSGFTVLSAGDLTTIGGYLTFRTLDTTDTANSDFLDLLDPSATPAEFEIVDSAGLGSTSTEVDFSTGAITHGTGMLTDSAYNVIIPLSNDPSTWIDAFNYPFDIDATLDANDSSGVTIPRGLFREFDITAPAGDAGTLDTTGTTYPVWVSKIEEDDSATTATLVFYLSTYPILNVDASNPIEFATLILDVDMVEGQIVSIVPLNDLYNTQTGSDWMQHFGRGHVVLSDLWGVSGGEVETFFSDFPTIVGSGSSTTFSQTGTRVSSFGISRVPKYTPTAGQSAALVGSGARRASALDPDDSNRYVTELDNGLGDLVDLDSESGISANAAIDRYGNKITLAHGVVKMVVDPEAASDLEDPTFYDVEILPRLRVLYGRDPEFGDIWYNGQRFLTFNGDSWVG